jgi:hypothetical protein
MTREYPKLPRALRAELLRHVGIGGASALAAKTGLHVGVIYRFVRDANVGARRSTIEALSRALGVAPESNGNGAHHEEPVPPKPERPKPEAFTLRVGLTVKRAERLVSHCDLHGITMSSFVAGLIDAKLDEIWGKEEAS